MSKNDLRNAFSSMEAIPPHPTQNAIGFETYINGIPSAIICYFNSKFFKEKVGAINLMIFNEPPTEVFLLFVEYRVFNILFQMSCFTFL